MTSKLSLSPLSPPSATLGHLNRLLASTSGQDKVFMLIAYGAKVADFALRSKRLGKTTRGRLDLAERISKLGALVSDARVLYRLFGLFPIIQWAQSLNDPATAPKDSTLKWIQKAQCWSMLTYYPLEHFYYLAGKGIFTATPQRIGTLAIWSCRFWAAYVVLQILAIRRNYQLLAERKASLASSRKLKLQQGAEKVTSADVEAEKKEIQVLRKKQAGLENDSLVQAGYLPLTMHWSIPGGILPDPVYVGLCGSLAAVAGLRGVWRATA